MGAKALEIYQGSDWFTYRWPVAQVFDTLDRMQDLCLNRAWEQNTVSPAEISEGLSAIADLCDDLAGELATVEADLLLFTQNNVMQRWQAVEMRHYLAGIRQQVGMSNATEPHYLFDQLLMLLGRIKETLKQLDQ